MADVGFMSAVKLTQSLRDGDISSRELFEHYLSRIETHNPALNAVVTLDSERAQRRPTLRTLLCLGGRRLAPFMGCP